MTKTVSRSTARPAKTIRTKKTDERGFAVPSLKKGEHYAGLTIHNGHPHHLILLPEEREEINWKSAGAWAKRQGGTLPSRIDMLVLWQKLKTEFKQSWYWSCEQHAGGESYAWFQLFPNGLQDGCRKSLKLRARAVRRVSI